jgi:hypothetical protein
MVPLPEMSRVFWPVSPVLGAVVAADLRAPKMSALRHQDRNAEGLIVIGPDDDVSIDELRETVEHMHGVPAQHRPARARLYSGV